jgi:hypothetical protein
VDLWLIKRRQNTFHCRKVSRETCPVHEEPARFRNIKAHHQKCVKSQLRRVFSTGFHIMRFNLTAERSQEKKPFGRPIKLSLCFSSYWEPRHKGALGEWRYRSTHSLTPTLDGGEWSASRPGRFTPRERAPGTHWIGGWVGPRAGLDAVVKRKIPSPLRESNPDHPVRSPELWRYKSTHSWPRH